ncbi:MAG: helix-turn-helix transcriptional regulator [Eubacteriales bacterium]|jgi:transcriptional regulator with XRE-family HTH domain|nr:helix-turn-helix transcriptional regulator [Eubacteriales bacterium]
MKLKIGDQIKYFRRAKDITQEEFAIILGVSYQSVSRWENNTCYPDMELLPTIADFFEITVDKLLGVDESIEKAHVNEYLRQFQSEVSVGNINECITIARKGVAEYPNNFALLNKLMYALFMSGDDDGNIPDWQENMKKYDAEITALGERITKYCPDQNIRLEATSRLAFNHCEMGRKEIGRAIYETLPSAEYSRENQMWWGLSDDEKLPFTRERIKQGFDIFTAGIYSLISYRLLPDEELITVFEKRIALDQIMYDGETPDEDWGKARLFYHYARTLLRLNKKPEAFDKLGIAVKCVNAFDNRHDETNHKSVLMGDIMVKKTDFETDDNRSLREIMRDKWLASPDFDSVRDSREFQEIIRALL